MSSYYCLDNDLLLVLTTERNVENANNLARNILRMRLATCINFHNIKSSYWWEGEIQEDSEVELVIKTKENLLDELFSLITNLHSYKVPQFIFFKATCSNDYYKFLKDNLVN